jgi:membrane protein implicated in regulation of membrane protease activity
MKLSTLPREDLVAGWLETARSKAPELPRSEACMRVRRSKPVPCWTREGKRVTPEMDILHQPAKWSPRIFLRYALLQLPALVLLVLLMILLRRWLLLPGWVMAAIIALWIAKDVILYPLVWRAYDSRAGKGSPMAGLRGIVVDRLHPSGYIKVRGELWHAETAGDSVAVERGEPVRVVGNRGLTLLVRPDDPDSGHEEAPRGSS